jgi:hypothetical protein
VAATFRCWHIASVLRRGDMSGVGCKREVTGLAYSNAFDPERTFLAGSPKVSSPDHLAKKRLISSKNRAAAGSCFRKR